MTFSLISLSPSASYFLVWFPWQHTNKATIQVVMSPLGGHGRVVAGYSGIYFTTIENMKFGAVNVDLLPGTSSGQ